MSASLERMQCIITCEPVSNGGTSQPKLQTLISRYEELADRRLAPFSGSSVPWNTETGSRVRVREETEPGMTVSSVGNLPKTQSRRTGDQPRVRFWAEMRKE